MTSSFEQNGRARNGARSVDDLPPALSSMWRLLKLGFRFEPSLMFVALVLSLLSALPDSLLALWLKFLSDGVLEHDAGLIRLAAVALGVSGAAHPFLRSIVTSIASTYR